MLNFLLIHVSSSGHFVYVWKICSIDSTFRSNLPLYNCKGIVSFIGSFLKKNAYILSDYWYLPCLNIILLSLFHFLGLLLTFPHQKGDIDRIAAPPHTHKLVLKTLNPRMQWDKALDQTIFTLYWKELSETEKVVLSAHWDWFSLLSQTCI